MIAASPIPQRSLDIRRAPGGVFEAERTVVADDPYQGGHYPGFLIYPGVLVVENVVRAALAALAEELPCREWRLRLLRSARFTAPVRPGDRLLVHGEYTVDEPTGEVRVRARCSRDDGVNAATVRLVFEPGGDGRAEPS